jgi:hypothetical protein
LYTAVISGLGSGPKEINVKTLSPQQRHHSSKCNDNNNNNNNNNNNKSAVLLYIKNLFSSLPPVLMIWRLTTKRQSAFTIHAYIVKQSGKKTTAGD